MKVKKIIQCLFISCLTFLGVKAQAQQLHVDITFDKTSVLDDTEFYFDADGGEGGEAHKMTQSGQKFSIDVNESKEGRYMLTSVKNGGQVNTPLYVPAGQNKKSLKAELKDGIFPVVTNDKDCHALTQLSYEMGTLVRKLWMEPVTEEQVKEMLGDYKGMVSHADPRNEASAPVKEYMLVQAYSTVHQNIGNLPQILRKKAAEIALKPSDVLPKANTVLDCEVAATMSYNAHIICEELATMPSLTEKLNALHTQFKTESVRLMAQRLLLNNFITRHDYQKKYTEGLKELTEAQKKYNLSQEYLDEYTKRSATISGAAFPEGFELVDRDGNKMDFSQFRGKYVYIDFWASWCGPCVKEVPHLQKMEEEVTNENVVFLSISIDSSKAPWIKKMDELKMHGNQWLNENGKICEALNISGIPMFLIYNKDGKLWMYDAPRPSQGEGLKSLLESLK